jgi:serine/threonine-protein kinase
VAAPVLAPLTPGTIFDGRYEIVRPLGAGSYGEVYEAFDRHQKQVVAVKLLRRAASGGVWIEAELLTRLEDKHILRVLNADVAAGQPYLVTELAVHGTLDGYLGAPGVPPKEAAQWVRHAARGTQRTHDAGLLHLDIKPGNIFLNAKGDVLLGDFGLATMMNSSGQGPAIGTPATKAPEVAAGGPSSVASDVYSLGATLYALLTGAYPHPSPHPRLRDAAPHISQALAQRVEKAMAADPADRYQKAADFDAALGELAASPRYWVRTDEHAAAGHLACWRGQASGKGDLTVCAIPRGTKFDVLARHDSTGRRITAACRSAVGTSQLSRALRTAFRDAN